MTSSPHPVSLAVASGTDRGLKRPHNEDSLLASSPLFVVADGMGGYEAGDLASAAIVDAFRTRIGDADYATLESVRDALVAAEAAVGAIADTTRRGAGSTVTGAALVELDGQPNWLVFNVGDSRVYRHTGSSLEQVTVDHSLGQELVDQGKLAPEELFDFANRNVITRAIGASESTADSWLMPVTNGERLLVCSDGLTSELSDESIRATLTMSGRPEAAVEALIEGAKRAGGRDNITVIVVDVRSGGVDDFGDGTTGALSHAVVLTDADETTIPV